MGFNSINPDKDDNVHSWPDTLLNAGFLAGIKQKRWFRSNGTTPGAVGRTLLVLLFRALFRQLIVRDAL